MCFTPTISMTIALVEFATAIFIVSMFKRSKIAKQIALFVTVLGIYQFTQYMLCKSPDPELWARLGFITYTWLPAIGLHITLKFTKRKRYIELAYMIPFIFTVIAIATKEFITKSECMELFVVAKTMLINSNFHEILMPMYIVYYGGFIIACFVILWLNLKEEMNPKRKWFCRLAMIALATSLIPALVLIVIFPELSIQFPSMYCEFAVLFAILGVIAVYIDDKKHKKILVKKVRNLKKALKKSYRIKIH